jgi:hypothetical protein
MLEKEIFIIICFNKKNSFIVIKGVLFLFNLSYFFVFYNSMVMNPIFKLVLIYGNKIINLI